MKVTYAVTRCPHCMEEIMSGHHRFGPKQVLCFSCNKVIETGLTPWAELSTKRKLLLFISEIIVPSWNLPVKAFFGNLFAWYFVSAALGFIGYGIINAYGNGASWINEAITIDVIVAAIIGFCLVPFRRLIRMILESNKYSKSGTLPVWQISGWMKRDRK